MKKSSFILLALLLMLSCNTNKDIAKFEKATLEKTSSYFEVGEGGGFSGLYNQYKIYSNGLVEKYDFTSKEYQSWKQIDEKKAAGFLKIISDLNLFEEEINMPGNMTEYLIIYDENKVATKLAWPSGGKSVNLKIYTLYKEAYTTCNMKEDKTTEE